MTLEWTNKDLAMHFIGQHSLYFDDDSNWSTNYRIRKKISIWMYGLPRAGVVIVGDGEFCWKASLHYTPPYLNAQYVREAKEYIHGAEA